MFSSLRMTLTRIERPAERSSSWSRSRVPSVEYQMHWNAYQARPDSTGAIHTHAPVATAFGIANQSFPPINTDAVFLRDTVTVPWYMPGSKELAIASRWRNRRSSAAQ